MTATGLASMMAPGRALAQDRYDLQALLAFDPPRQVSILHLADMRGLLMPQYHRPAQVRIGAGGRRGEAGEALRRRHGVGGRTYEDYALTHDPFGDLAAVYGPMGGLAHVMRLIDAIRAERPDCVLALSGRMGGGPLGILDPLAEAENLARLRADVHLGAAAPAFAVQSILRGPGEVQVVQISTRFTAQDTATLERALQDLPGLVIGLSDLGSAADQWLAAKVPTFDVILSRGRPTPTPLRVGGTAIVASGHQGRFLTRVDLDPDQGEGVQITHRLIPVFSDIVPPDVVTAQVIDRAFAPHRTNLMRVIGRANGVLETAEAPMPSWQRLIGAAVLAETRAKVALLDPLQGGHSILRGGVIRQADVLSVTGGCAVQEVVMTGREIVGALQNAADLAFHEDPVVSSRQGMLGLSGASASLTPTAAKGAKVSEVRTPGGHPLDPDGRSRVAVVWRHEAADGMLAQMVGRYIGKRGRVGYDLPMTLALSAP